MTNFSIAGSAGTTGVSHWASPTPAGKLLAVDPSDTSTPPAGSAGSDKWVSIGQMSAPMLGWQNVLAFGADPTGTADSTTTVNAAITAAGAGGKTYFPPGLYKISGALAVPNGASLLAPGPSAVTVQQTSTTANGISVVSGSAISDVTLEGFTLTGPSAGSGIGIFASANAGAANVERLTLRNLIVGGFGSHGIRVQNGILSTIGQVKSWFNLGRGYSLETGTTWTCYSSWAAFNAAERGWYLNGILASTLNSCGADDNALGYELLSCSGVTLSDCDGFNNAAAGGLDGSTFKINASFGINLLGPYIGANAAVGLYVTGGSSGVFASGVTETATGSPTASVKTDAGTSLVLFGVNLTTAPSYSGGTALFMSPAYTFFSVIEAGSATVDGLLTLDGGTATTSPPVITGIGAVSGTAKQLSDLTRDYTVYLECTTSGTATTLTMGHTVAATDVTIMASAAATAGQVISFRLPAGWWFKWAGTTTAFGTQNAVGC